MTAFGWWLTAGTAAALLFTVVAFAARARSGGLGRVPDPATAPALQPSEAAVVVTVRGGAWINGLNVSWPFATLTIDESHAKLRALFAAPVTINRSEVTGLAWRPGFAGRGIRFRTDSGRLDRVTFWPMPWSNAREKLARVGWQ
jgi:hypothetical protein